MKNMMFGINKMKISLLGIILMSYSIWACSGVYIADKNVKLLGLNEDFYNSDTIYKTMPATDKTFGIIGFGHSNSIQAIINDQGLCYDGYGAPEKEVTLNKDLPENNGSFIFQAMTTCGTVAEVVALYNKSYHPWLSASQVFFADRFGSSVIIEGDNLLYKNNTFQICTNFYQSDPESGVSAGFYPCKRFDYLQNELKTTTEYSVEFVKGLLKSVHVEKQISPFGPISTVYSLIVDQNKNKIYVYNMHNFEEVKILDIKEELGKKSQSTSLSSLF